MPAARIDRSLRFYRFMSRKDNHPRKPMDSALDDLFHQLDDLAFHCFAIKTIEGKEQAAFLLGKSRIHVQRYRLTTGEKRRKIGHQLASRDAQELRDFLEPLNGYADQPTFHLLDHLVADIQMVGQLFLCQVGAEPLRPQPLPEFLLIRCLADCHMFEGLLHPPSRVDLNLL